MEDLIVNIPVEYFINTGWYRSDKSVLSHVDFDEIERFCKTHDINRNIKEEVLDLIDMVKGVYGNKAEASKDGILVSKNPKNGWKIEICI